MNKEPLSGPPTICDDAAFAELRRLVHDVAGKRQRPDGSSYRSLLFAEERQLVALTGCSHRQVQLAALKEGIMPERYARNQRSISQAEQIRMLESQVAIVGLGGLGGAVCEILSRIGIGKLTLIDGDRFEDSNLNRQLLCSTDLLGVPKAEAAAHRVAEINPAVEVQWVVEYLTADNCLQLLDGAGIGVDCLDTIPARFALEAGCRQLGIPMVTAAIGGTSGQVMVVFPEDRGLRQIYGDPGTAQRKGIETTLGTLPYTATAVAAVECAEIVAIATGRPAQLRNRLLLVDLADHLMEAISFS